MTGCRARDFTAPLTAWVPTEAGAPVRAGPMTARRHEMVYRIRPKIVIPIHTRSPHRLHPVGGPVRVQVGYARRYDFAGRPLPEPQEITR